MIPMRYGRCLLVMATTWLVASTLLAQTAEQLTQEATGLAKAGKSAEAIQLLDQAITTDKTYATAHYLRGREHFRLGKIRESVADFDEYVRLEPRQESRQWERGISLYYAGEYERGARQFELYQTFEGNDVENAIWRYLCLAKAKSTDVARDTLLPIDNDRRVPMMQIYELYRGKFPPDKVVPAAQDGNPSPEVLAGRLFYAHLYLGLYFESQGNIREARKYINLAADAKLAANPRLNSYMWDVARVHAQSLPNQVKE